MNDCANLKTTNRGYTMFKTLRSLTAILLSVILLAIPTQPASATVPEGFTYSEFYAMPLAKELVALQEANQQRYFLADAVEVTTVSRAEFLGEFSEARIEMLLSADLARYREYTITKRGENLTEEIGMIEGQYYVALPSPGEVKSIKNYDAALSRLKKTGRAWMLVDDQSFGIATPELEQDILFNSISDPAQIGAALVEKAWFRDLTKSVSQTDSNLVDYKFSVTVAGGNNLFTKIDQTTTFNSEGELISQMLKLDILGISSTTTTTYKITTVDKIVVPETYYMVSLAAFKKASHQISAEKSLSSKVKALTSKATALAKSTRKTLTSKHLVDGAKALKYTVTSIKNGVRLSAKYLGVEGRMCLVASKGKVVATACS